jgi:DNA-binding winged helix-turn-helix (wHTH) protein/TolB-like protein/Flp pilus assembly protein TadD
VEQQDDRRFYEFGAFALDTVERVLECRNDGRSVRLTPRVYDTLLYFLEHPNELIDKRRLIDAVWPNLVVEDNNLDQTISTLRHALGERGRESRYIVTVRGRGYRLAVPVVARPHAGVPATGESDSTAAASTPIEPSPAPVSPAPKPRSRTAVAAAAVGLVALLAAALLWTGLKSAPIEPTPAPKLAVLPFRPLTADDRSESLELGMAETLIAGLNTADLTVAPLSTVRRYASPDVDPLAAGREIGATAVLEGYLQRDADHLRVSARLLNVADGRQLWAARYDEAFTDIFSVQDAIAARVRESLMPQLVGEVRSLPHYTQSAEAYELYVTGRLHRQRGNVEALRQSLAYFERAVQEDPGFALAHVGVADVHAILGVFGVMAPHDTFPQARLAVQRALSLAPDLAEAHASLGHIKTQYEHDWAGAELELRRAVELNPYYALGQQWLGLFLAYSGDFEEGLERLRMAYSLEPSAVYGALIGMVLNYARRYDEAVEQLEAMLAADPASLTTRTYLALAYMRTGQLAEATRHLSLLPTATPGSMSYVGQIAALEGRRADALAEIERLIAHSQQRYVPAYDIAAVYGALAEIDATFIWLERAFDERSQLVGWLPWDAAFDSIREDSRYAALLQRLNVAAESARRH